MKAMQAMPLALALLAVLGLLACRAPRLEPLRTVPRVDLPRFMGDWYVIASIPTFLEQGAHNAVESYRLEADGSIATTFTFRKGAFNGPEKRYTPRGFVQDRASNAVWGMRFLWPIKADYRIIHLADDYSVTVVGREKRDYVWIMARRPVLADGEYRALLRLIERQGYDVQRIERVPQQWH